jgi:hypothetical protein
MTGNGNCYSEYLFLSELLFLFELLFLRGNFIICMVL